MRFKHVAVNFKVMKVIQISDNILWIYWRVLVTIICALKLDLSMSPGYLPPPPLTKNLGPDIPYPPKGPDTRDILPSPCVQNDRCLWKHYLPLRSVNIVRVRCNLQLIFSYCNEILTFSNAIYQLLICISKINISKRKYSCINVTILDLFCVYDSFKCGCNMGEKRE